MKQFLEIFLQAAFACLILGSVAALFFAVVAESAGWYDSNGCYIGPFSKRRRK